MAKSYYSLGRSLSRAEAIAGWCYLPFYLVLLSAGIQYLAAALHVSLTALTINIIYFSINLLFVLLVFRNFLLQRFFGSGFFSSALAPSANTVAMLAIWLCWVRYSKMRDSSRSSSTCIWFLGVSAYLVKISVMSFVAMPKSFATSCTLYLFATLPK